MKARNAQATLMEQITEMDTDTANKYMGMLLATTDDQWNQYVTAWNKKMQLAKDISESYYKDQFTALNKSYSTKIAAEMKKLKTELKQIGKNVMNGFISGVKSMEGSVSSTIKGIVESAVRAAKKYLKIKSPSRVFKEIGVMSIRGAEVGVTDRAENLYKATTDVAETFADKFAKANLDIPEIYSRAKSIVASQVSKIPIAAQIQTGLSQAAEETGGTEALVIHTHADIDGREVASTTARFTDRELGTIKGRKERGA
ncbi:MAG: hypothetical protein GX671_05920 [Clostridiales bacterium]|nr:hypothetical protein [Clostridiales bacterium]